MIGKSIKSLSSIDIIRILCIKIGTFQNMSRLRFLRRYGIKIKIFNLFNEFMTRDIFEQSDSLSGVLISLFGNNSDAISSDLAQNVRITPASIEMVIDDFYICYTPKEDKFDIDTLYGFAEGIKFSYYKNSNMSKHLSDVWNALLQPLEARYMRIIYFIADILNNPSINKEVTIDEKYIDPFID